MDLDREFTTGWKVEKYRYYANDLHRMIGVADAPGRVSLSNIGCNGENLTIAVLSMNRADVTIRLMDSIAKYIPNFAGEFLKRDLMRRISPSRTANGRLPALTAWARRRARRMCPHG
ncbi:MAG: hypothetical protein KHW91_13655 [Clostridiales bacterium]|nr:hypothetical protein [Clostridiales bacterium]